MLIFYQINFFKHAKNKIFCNFKKKPRFCCVFRYDKKDLLRKEFIKDKRTFLLNLKLPDIGGVL